MDHLNWNTIARAPEMPHFFHLFSMIAGFFLACTDADKNDQPTRGKLCYFNREPQKLVPSRNFSHLKPQKFVPANHKKSPIRKIKLPQNFQATRYDRHVISDTWNDEAFLHDQSQGELCRERNSMVQFPFFIFERGKCKLQLAVTQVAK